MLLSLGVDLGGTKIAAGVMAAGGRLLSRARRPTGAADGPEAVIARIIEACREAVQAAGVPVSELAGIGIAAPGPLDPRSGEVLAPPNLPGWERVPLRDRLAAALGLPASLENDANCAALAEHRYGAGQGCRELIYVTVSTGIGAGLILGGRLYRGAAGVAGELGHVCVDPQGPPCNCGRAGCVEALASGPALARRTGRPPEELVAAAQQGEATARRHLAGAAAYLGAALASAIHLLNPERVVIGGGVAAGAGDLFLAPLQEAIRAKSLPAAAAGLTMVPAALGEDAGILGAAALFLPEAAAEHPPRRVDKPWGHELWWAHTDRYVGKFLSVRAGSALSLQYHREKLESMHCLAGQGSLLLGDQTISLSPGVSVTIHPGTVHRLEAETDLTVLEVSTPEVEDVVRLADRYGR